MSAPASGAEVPGVWRHAGDPRQRLAVIMATGVQQRHRRHRPVARRAHPRATAARARNTPPGPGFGIAALVMCTLAMLLYGLLRGDWLDALLGGIALGMALLPEEFPLVLTVFTVMGAWRLSRSRVLTRRAAVIESLGAATVLCTDKTGTLTRNLMSVARLEADDGAWEPQDSGRAHRGEHRARRAARDRGAGQRRPSRRPMERALVELWERLRPERARRRAAARVSAAARAARGDARVGRRLDSAWPRRRARRRPSHACARSMPAATARAARARVEALAARGMRVLAVARPRCEATLPAARGRRSNSSYLGLVAFADPLRESVPEAVRECRAAGIRVVMITGDYPATARAIAEQAGIEARSRVSGERAGGARRRRARARACATRRSSRAFRPTQKLRIVEALKAQRRGGRDDRRRRQRRAGAQGRAHRHRHGRTRHRRGARGGLARAARRRLRLHRARQCAWAAGSTTTCARPWATSSPSTCRSPAWRCCRCCSAGRCC